MTAESGAQPLTSPSLGWGGAYGRGALGAPGRAEALGPAEEGRGGPCGAPSLPAPRPQFGSSREALEPPGARHPRAVTAAPRELQGCGSTSDASSPSPSAMSGSSPRVLPEADAGTVLLVQPAEP
nr:WAS/WASL-interacting protein family member 1-like [Symphalangus syndactylus]